MTKYLIIGIVVLLTCIFFLFTSLSSTTEKLGKYKSKVDYLEVVINDYKTSIQSANKKSKETEKIIQQLREKMNGKNEECYNNSIPIDVKLLLHNM